jgi:hypothetical protein
MLDLLAGRRRVGPVTELGAAGAANAVVIFTLSTFASMMGAKNVRIKRLKLQSLAVGVDTWVHIGTGVGGVGAGFIAMLPPLRLVNNTTNDYPEDDLPQVEFNANITAYMDNGIAASVVAQVEVEEIG